jgi:hypothetical protein
MYKLNITEKKTQIIVKGINGGITRLCKSLAKAVKRALTMVYDAQDHSDSD